MNLKRKAVTLLCAVLLIVSGAVPKAFADWYDDIESGYSVKIVGQNFVADTFCGVNAYYNESGNSVYHCGEVVERFYREVYGLDVEIRSTEPRLRINNEGYKIVTTKTAKPGDVIFVSAAMRGTYDHWAIVKYVKDGYLVLFEQNVVYNGCAGVERKLKYPSDSYIIYTVVREDGSSVSLQGTQTVTEETTVNQTETTTEPTTAAKLTTTKAVTTAKPTTTVKPTTTEAVTTTKPTTTAKPTTTKAATTVKATTKPSTTAEVTTTVTETTTTEEMSVIEVTTAISGIYTTEIQTETPTVISAEHTEKAEEKKSKKATVPLASACGVSASGVAVLAVLIKKKSDE